MSFTLIGSVADVITTVMTTIGIPGLLALMAVESFGIPPIPSEVILPFAGFLVADGTFNLGWALTAALAGSLLGSFAAYAVGRWWRDRMLGLGIGQLRLKPHHLDRVDRFFVRRGEITVGLSRLVPVIRSYISYPAGTARMEPVRFGVYTLLGSIPFTLALVYAGIVLGSNWNAVSSYFRYFDIPLAVLVGFAVVYLALQVFGVFEPGWPPRRRRRPENAASSGGAPPGPPPSSH